ncbi:hypothetical protein [Hymenobacter sp. CRA2]|uniref:hypothetical protein n=1 Tax=Hymenobacter sp. CRA2 TaxID=1955620 RepID=UPI0011172A45|nr:hypothetical protein [Hymenobacter sp. CRA2]
MRFLIPPVFVRQHRVLDQVYNVPSINDFPNVSEIANSTGMTEDEVVQAAYLLLERGMVSIDRGHKPYIIRCSPEGASAYLQKKLLAEGDEKGKANLLRWMQIFGIIVAASITISTFIMNLIKTDSNTNRITKVESEIQLLKAKPKD